MTKINFDLITNNAAILDGNVTAHLLDGDGDANSVIDRHQASAVHVDFGISGTWAWLLWGTWHLKAVAESIGPGPEFNLGTMDIPMTLVPPVTNRTWSVNIPIPPGTVTADGPYKIVLLLTHSVNLATVPPSSLRTRMAGFVEIPVVEYYTHDI